MLHCIKCSAGFDAQSAQLLLQSSPVYYHSWNSKQLPESSIHLHIFPIPCCLHHSSPPSVTAFVPPAAPVAKGWRVECRAAGKGWCVKPCCWQQRLCDSTSMKAVMDVGAGSRSWLKSPTPSSASPTHPQSTVTVAGYNKIALRVIGVFGDVTTTTFHKCQSNLSLTDPALIPFCPVFVSSARPLPYSPRDQREIQQRFSNRPMSISY